MITQSSEDNRQGKRVRFNGNDSIVVFEAGEAESPLWLAQEEYDDFRQKVQEEADSLKPKGYSILLKNGFDESFALSQKYLNAFAKLPEEHCLRGSEVYISKQHRENRDQILRKLSKAVLRRQHLLLENETPADELAEKLRSISKKNSRGSRIFARRIGLADQRAVKEGDDLLVAFAIVKELTVGNAKMARRKASVQTGLAGMTGLAYMSSASSLRINQEFSSTSKMKGRPNTTIPTILLPTAHAANGTGNSCSRVIKDALGLLDNGDDMCEPFTQINATRTSVAKSA